MHCMSSVCLPHARPNVAKAQTLRHKFYSLLALFALWAVCILVLLFGLPIIIYQTLTRPRPITTN